MKYIPDTINYSKLEVGGITSDYLTLDLTKILNELPPAHQYAMQCINEMKDKILNQDIIINQLIARLNNAGI